MSDLPPSARRIRSAERDFRDLAGGAMVVFFGKLGRASRGAFLWVITLLCGLEVLGLYSFAWGLVSTLNKVARFGVLRGVVHFVNEARTRQPGDGDAVNRALAAAVILILGASGLVALVVVLAADHIAAFYDKPVAQALRILALTTPFIAASWVFTSATRALRIMRYEVYVRSIAGPLVLLAGGVAVGLAGLGLRAVACVQVAMALCNCLLAIHFFRHHFQLRPVLRALGRGTPWRRMAAFNLPVMVTDTLYATLTQLDVFMLLYFVPAHLVGLFTLARRVSGAMLKAPQAFDPIFSSVVSELSLQNRNDELGHRFVVISRWILTINLPIFAGLLIIGDTLLPILAGDDPGTLSELQTGLAILVILCVSAMVQGVFAMAEPLLAMSGRPGLNLANNSLWLATNFGLNIWLIGRYGIVGAAWGALASVLMVNILRIGQVYWLERVLPFGWSQLKPLLAAAVATAPAVLAYGAVAGTAARLLVPTCAFLPIYGGGLLLLGFEDEDRMLWSRLRRRLFRVVRPDSET